MALLKNNQTYRLIEENYNKNEGHSTNKLIYVKPHFQNLSLNSEGNR